MMSGPPGAGRPGGRPPHQPHRHRPHRHPRQAAARARRSGARRQRRRPRVAAAAVAPGAGGLPPGAAAAGGAVGRRRRRRGRGRGQPAQGAAVAAAAGAARGAAGGPQCRCAARGGGRDARDGGLLQGQPRRPGGARWIRDGAPRWAPGPWQGARGPHANPRQRRGGAHLALALPDRPRPRELWWGSVSTATAPNALSHARGNIATAAAPWRPAPAPQPKARRPARAS
jgi:hypothetical protein